MPIAPNRRSLNDTGDVRAPGSADPFGHLLEAIDRGQGQPVEIVERDDGVFFTGGGEYYLRPFEKWGWEERRALRYARGRVLDLGTGAGRVLIHLQANGIDAVGIEASPLVARVARRRGARNVRVMRVEEIDSKLGTFDTVVMFGNNFGMLGTVPKTRRLLKRLLDVTTDGARILAGSVTPYPARTATQRAYFAHNRRLGKPPGTLRIRLRYAQHATPWLEWLFFSPRELERVVAGTGWRMTKLLKRESPLYVAVLERSPAA
jgi:SAM-dependent methyltransferase